MRVLVVDDEVYTREGILEFVDWEALGVDEVMDADDGLAALSIAEWFHPDIVISDVKMPQMDGITFARQFLEQFPGSKIIFMSAYMEIQYYQQAIKLSAVDYVEKPLDMDEMVQAVKKAVGEIQEKQEGDHKSRIMLEEQVVNYLLNPRRKLSQCQELCRQIGFPTEGNYICLCFKDLEREDNKHLVTAIINEFFQERRFVSLAARNDSYCYCCILAMDEITKNRYSMLDLGRQFVNQYPSFQIGIGFHVDHLSGISESWRLSRDAMNQAFYEPQRMVFEKVQLTAGAPVVDSGIYSRVNQVIMKEPAKLPIVVDAVFAEFERNKSLNPASIKAFAKAVVSDILQHIANEEAARKDIFFGQTPEEYIENSESLDEIRQILTTASSKLLGMEEYQGNSLVVKNAYRYIRKAYANPDLGLTEIAEESGISTGYLSMVFKKETGVTVRQYIEDYRIEAAKDKLMHSSEKVQSISASCGFAQHGYFSRVFKLKTGMTPAEFREKYYE